MRGATVLRGEQSNTSIIYRFADAPGLTPMICKVFRVLHAGLNPDIELQSALAAAGSPHVPRVVGRMDGSWGDPEDATLTLHGSLAFAQEFMPGTQDAWRVALESIRSGEDFVGAATPEGAELAAKVRDTAIALYSAAVEYAATRGIIIADTKFEFGLDEDGTLTLMDEALTPDSSRFWPADSYAEGSNPPSFDKQFVRDWLESTGWNKQPPAPAVPADVAQKTADKYREALTRLTQ